ncbi:MAG: transposase [Flavobacteriales bacterium Tduv]
MVSERSTRRIEFFQKVKNLDPLERDGEKIRKIYQKSQGIKGQPAYSGISLFKIMLLSHWYNLSDVATEELVKEYLMFMRFCGFLLKDQIPDHTTLCRFRNEIVAKKAY